MKTARIQVDDGHLIHDHGEVRMERKSAMDVEANVEGEFKLVIAPENFAEFKEELEELIAKYAL